MDGSFQSDLFTAPIDDTLPPMIVDSFAGGGGASTGIEMALGRSPDVAINHDEQALGMHAANHAQTVHLTESIWDLNPRDVIPAGRRVGLLWASPDCTHHSRAKGGKPVDNARRGLADVVHYWAEWVKPDVILLENVPEFVEWGPLGLNNRPDRERKGVDFQRWCRGLTRRGYRVQWRVMRACDYGAPTIRKRLFVVARCDDRPIVWPKPTHGDPKSASVQRGLLKPWPVAADCIDWSIPCPSIFAESDEIMAEHGLRAVRPLKPNTLRRIAKGIQRYVIDNAEPFLVVCNHGGDHFRGQGLDAPMATVTASRDAHGLVRPVVARADQVAAFMAQHNSNAVGRRADDPLATTTTRGTQTQIVAASLEKMYGTAQGASIADPLHTVTAGGGKHGLLAATMVQTGYGERSGQAPRALDIEKPLGTVVAGGAKHAVIAAHCQMMRNAGQPAWGADEPMRTIPAGGAGAFAVAAFMSKYYGQGDGASLDDPCHTVTTRDRFGLVTVTIAGEPWVIVDIGMRMLTPRELFRAQGFPDDYVIDRMADGTRLTKTAQVRMCGNSVSPHVAAALARANCAHLMEKEIAA